MDPQDDDEDAAREHSDNEQPDGIEESKDDKSDTNGRKAIVITDAEKASNLDRVQFTPAVAKQIISKHSGSILVSDEPAITVSRAIIDNATRIFEQNQQAIEQVTQTTVVSEGKEEDEQKAPSPRPRTVNRSQLTSMIAECGFTAGRVESICSRMYSGPEEMEIGDFINFFTRFYAPSFYYGQRLRRYVGRGEMDDVFDLLARGCDVNAGDGEGLCPLHYAAIYNRAKAIDELVAYAPDTILVNAVDRYGWSPLHCACQHGNLDCVLSLMKAGADVCLKDKNGKTPLHVATCQSRNNIIDALIERDPSLPNIQDSRGMTPLHDAAFKGHQKTYNIMCNAAKADVDIKDMLGNKCSEYVAIMEDKITEGESKR